MPKYILKLVDPADNTAYYLEWSSVVDSPVTWGFPLDKFKAYYAMEYGANGMRELPDRLARVEQHGSSGHQPFHDAATMVETNRAGYKERSLSFDDLLDWYCKRQHDGMFSYTPPVPNWRRTNKVIRLKGEEAYFGEPG